MTKSSSSSGKDRQQRLAEALRANLRRRKDQGRQRRDPVEPNEAAAPQSPQDET